jgi:hypothetical protein
MGVTDVCRGGVFLFNDGGYNPKDGQKLSYSFAWKCLLDQLKVEEEAK